METKSVRYWAASLLMLFSFSLLAQHEHGGLRIEGRVTFEDGQPFSGAIVTVTELRGRLFRKPAVSQRLRVTADQDGRFLFELESIRGILDIRATHETCIWAGSRSKLLQREDWHQKSEIWVELSATRGNCEELIGDPSDTSD